MKFISIIIIFFLAGCAAQFKKLTPQEFQEASKGKRIFLVGGPISDGNTIYDFCDSFDELICSKKLDKYQGLKGFIVEPDPVFSDKYYYGYNVVLETGEKLVLKLSNATKGRDPIDAALFLVDVEKVAEAQSLKGKYVLDGLAVTFENQSSSRGLLIYTLSNGEAITKDELDQRIHYLKDEVLEAKRNDAFDALSNLSLKFDDFEQIWWVKPKSHSEMSLYPYFGKDKESKWLRFTAKYKGSDWIFFEKISIISAEDRYDNTFKRFDVSRDNGGGKVWEWIDISATSKEISILETLSRNPGKIRFSGKYVYTNDISPEYSLEINSLMKLFELTNPQSKGI